MNRIEHVSPSDIEKRSFEIIADELNNMGIVLDVEEDKITRRCIHTSADFEYAKTMYYSEGAIDRALYLIRSGCRIVTDTNMALTGINKKRLEKYGCKCSCFMADDDVAETASKLKVTRAAVSMEKAAEIGEPTIFAIGNAPTALIKLREMYYEGIYVPALIIGVPVGFVNVEAAKEMIIETDIPCIVNRGRKGGSNIAAAIVNALVLKEEDR